MRVMVVDDRRTMRMIVTRALHNIEEVGHVIQAESAEEAIDLLQSEPVDLVLCDWNMPGMDGIELLEALRAAEWPIPFGFITAHPGERARQRAMRVGAAFLLTKPFTESELADAIHRLAAPPDEFATDDDARGPHDQEWGNDRAKQLEDIVSKLCSAKTCVSVAESGAALRSPRQVVTYVSDDDEPTTVCVLDTSLALAVVASMSRLPAQVARDWAATGIVPLELAGDLSEFADVLAAFVRYDGQLVRVEDITGYAPGERVAVDLFATGAKIEHFEVEIEGYRGGCCTILGR